jgi:hypothetical protein
MFTSIMGTDQPTTEQVPRSSPPWVWIGFLFAGAFFTIEIAFVLLDLDERGIDLTLRLVVIAGWIYYTVCVHRIHKILNELTQNRYPYTAGEAAGRHYIPFYNFVWLFKWPSELSRYINGKGRVRILSGGAIGAMLLLSLLLRFFDGAFGMAVLFGVTMYVSAKVKQHVNTLKGVTADQLPPLPDPRIFSRPAETATVPAQTIAESAEPAKSL